ncbi:MAG: hypothetical protein HY675_12795 [Chloroflexi bacterium]|nr:hypothetical protein [Chloroflexota bacterium]
MNIYSEDARTSERFDRQRAEYYQRLGLAWERRLVALQTELETAEATLRQRYQEHKTLSQRLAEHRQKAEHDILMQQDRAYLARLDNLSFAIEQADTRIYKAKEAVANLGVALEQTRKGGPSQDGQLSYERVQGQVW